MKRKRKANPFLGEGRIEKRISNMSKPRNLTVPFLEELERKAKSGNIFALRKLARHRRKV